MRGRVQAAVGTEATAVSRGRRRRVGVRWPALLERPLLAVLGAALALAVTSSARAQTTSTSTSSSSSLTPLRSQSGDITLYPNTGIERRRYDHPQNRPWWISYEDCIENDVFTFSLSTTAGASGYDLQVWAGTQNCPENIGNETTIGQCWILARKTVREDDEEIQVPVRNVVNRRLGSTLPGALGPDVCDNSDEVNGETISWFFVVIKNGLADEYLVWDGGSGRTGFDVVGPTPPDGIRVGVGESQLALDIDQGPTDSTRERYEAFCVPEGTLQESVESGSDAGLSTGEVLGDGGLLDAGSGGAGSSDAGSVITCGSNVLQAGQRPTDLRFSCGTTNSISNTLLTDRLQNNTRYAVAVSGQDDLGNSGPLSEIECGTPIPLNDFFELYSRSGGPGGGGFCSVSPGRHAAGAGSAGVALLLLAGLGWRRARGRG